MADIKPQQAVQITGMARILPVDSQTQNNVLSKPASVPVQTVAAPAPVAPIVIAPVAPVAIKPAAPVTTATPTASSASANSKPLTPEELKNRLI